jgi:hypothetical protein
LTISGITKNDLLVSVMSQRASFPTPSDYYHQEVSEMDEGKADVRILLVGDGKYT